MTMRERWPPPHSGWREQTPPWSDAIASSAWASGPVWVVSALELLASPIDGTPVPQWHLSISRLGRRPRAHQVSRTLRAFGMVLAEEDHEPQGYARHFMLPVDSAHRIERKPADPAAYRWMSPYGVAECGGCAYERAMGNPCRLHARGSHA